MVWPLLFVGLIGLMGVLLVYAVYEITLFRQEAIQRMTEIRDLLRELQQKS